jgi:YVTN family beta-propeller protein
MRYSTLLFFPLLLACALLDDAPGRSAPPPERDRSPTDLALSADGRFALTANSTADTVSLVDLEAGRVVAETAVGQRPFAVALTPDGKHALVTNFRSDSATLLAVTPASLRVVETIPVGDEPRGVALSPDGKTAFVALSGEHAVAVVDITRKKAIARIPVGTEPWHLALTPDGKTLAVGNARSQNMSLVSVAERKLVRNVRLLGRNVRHVAVSSDGAWAYTPTISEQGRPTTKDNIDNGWVIANRLARVPLKEEGAREAMALDPRGKAVGDVDGVALHPQSEWIAITAGGTGELLLLRHPLPFIAYGGPTDHMDPALLFDLTRFRRVPLGGRPLGVGFMPDGKRLVIANYLSNSLQVVDAERAALAKTIPLGGPTEPSLARRGEAIFLDATRSFNQWFSCNTCHTEGHTNGGNFDTFNDGSYYTSKKTLSLRGLTERGPWTWHGWRTDLRELIKDSFTKSMQGPEPSEADLDALVAYFKTLEVPPSPYRNPDGSLTAAARRGEALFEAKGCATCHAPPLYTHPNAFDVGLEEPQDPYKGFKPPSLLNVYSRAPYLHDGSALTLETLLTKRHRPSQLTGKPDLTSEELRELIAFLKSL